MIGRFTPGVSPERKDCRAVVGEGEGKEEGQGKGEGEGEGEGIPEMLRQR